ncbi:ribokinase [Glaciecola petra]|uniref:Ribokinase n=1 Tax=Glaciecola petra TaxID=3075602 RepID=A0ABU2ZMQ4_9ALTE|nr:ribokinase [Aestuariibacter sp. P117]MDT0593531.1 ribokinase [Aestuariibacter sp. P117]
MAVINFGSINIDHVYSVEHFVAPGETLSSSAYKSVLGGKGANQSIACAKAGANIKHVGNIHANDHAFLNQMQDVNVDCNWVCKIDSLATGHAIIQVNNEGENAIVLYAGANHCINKTQIDDVLSNADKTDWVLLQNETNAIAEIIESASAQGLNIAFNPAPMTKEVSTLELEKVSLLIVNEIEAMQLTSTDTIHEASAELTKQYPKTKILLTLGKNGVHFMQDGNTIKVDSYKVKALDTTAAGDTFIGYFLAQYCILNKQDANNEVIVTQALKTACAAAALCVTKAGAAPSIPTQQEVAKFLSI